MKNIKQLINEKLTINKDSVVIEYQYLFDNNRSTGIELDPKDIAFTLITGNGEIFLFTSNGLKDFIEKNPLEIDGDYMMVFEELLMLKQKGRWTHLTGDENWDATRFPQTKDIKVMGIRYK